VRREHLERLRPVCPACRAAGRDAPPLTLGTVARGDGDDVLEGILLCPERLCRREHPIIDGIAVVVTDLVTWASHQLDAVLRRDDLTPLTESLLGDAAGPGSALDRERMNVSGYGHAHWGDLDPGDPPPARDGFVSLLERTFESLGEIAGGPWADLGCGVGRGTLELARRTGDLAVGVDLSFAMLRVAERVRREGRAVYPQRRVGLVFDRREFEVRDVPAEQMSFWCCDVAALPFPEATFAGALTLNLLDCAASPLAHLEELGRVLRPGADAVLTTPYDWTATATPLQQWIGGHSQRGGSEGSSAEELRRILSPDRAAGVDTGLVITAEHDRIPWRVAANERSSIEYEVHLLRLARREG
jgi:SAM-dependent methyltransferase/uncharacterized protein YbaR (Trm112 family)